MPVSRLFLSAVAVEAITAKNTHELWGCAEGLSIVHLYTHNWLEEAGFATYTPVTVIVEHGRLILQAVVAE